MEMVSKQDVLNIIHSEGGCDAKDEYTRGWDEACNSLYNLVRDMEAVKEIPVLSPCPFCGGKVYLHDNEGYDFEYGCSEESKYIPNVLSDEELESEADTWAECDNCGCVSGLYKSPKEAIMAWNRRYVCKF